jgi:hypothetical protein
MHLLRQCRIATTQHQYTCLLILNALLQVVFDFGIGGIPFEALLGLFILEELVPIAFLLELFVVLWQQIHYIFYTE